MNIIPYNNTHVQVLVSILFPTLDPIAKARPENFEEAFKQEIQSISCETYARMLERYDEIYRDSYERKMQYTIKDRRERTLITTIGNIRFRYYCYQSRTSGKYYSYLHTFLKLKSGNRISPQMKYEILKRVVIYSYRQIAIQFDNSISHTTVYHILKSFRHASSVLTHSDFTQVHNVQTLYIQADEIYVPVRNSWRKRSKQQLCNVTIHEGVERVCKGRNALIHKMCFIQDLDETRSDFTQRINQFIQRNYTFNMLYVYGDGASWIQTMATSLGAEYILDLFHVFQAVNRIIPRNQSGHHFLREAIETDDIEFFHETLIAADINWTKRRIQSKHYLLNNWGHIQQNYRLPHSVGGSQEGINFHVTSRRLTTIPSAWSLDNLYTVAALSSIFHSAFTDFTQTVKSLIPIDFSINRTHETNQHSTYDHVPNIPLINQNKKHSVWIKHIVSPS